MEPIWQRDGSAIYHGDCLSLLEELPRADLYLLDLPYGVDLQNHGHDRSSRKYEIKNDRDQSFGETVLAALSGPVIAFASPMRPWSGKWRQFLVWDKGEAVGAGGDIKTCWKPTWELIQVRNTPRLNGSRDGAVLTYHVNPSDFKLHPCQKPVSLLNYLITKTTQPDGLVIDLTCGSGSTVLAAIASGRRGIGVEIDPVFCHTAKARMAQRQLSYQ